MGPIVRILFRMSERTSAFELLPGIYRLENNTFVSCGGRGAILLPTGDYWLESGTYIDVAGIGLEGALALLRGSD